MAVKGTVLKMLLVVRMGEALSEYEKLSRWCNSHVSMDHIIFFYIHANLHRVGCSPLLAPCITCSTCAQLDQDVEKKLQDIEDFVRGAIVVGGSKDMETNYAPFDGSNYEFLYKCNADE